MAKKESEGGEAEAKPQKDKAASSAKAEGKAKSDKAKAKKAKAPTGPAPTYKREQPPRMKARYEAEVREQLKKEFGYDSAMQVPRLVKVVINMGLGRANQNTKLIETAVEELASITGQAPVVCVAKKDIANYKLRKGQKIGVMVTLRRERMWEFLDRLVNIALPRVRDFRGVSAKGFDGRGNFTLGIREQIIFPEIDYDAIDAVKGMNISIVTTAQTDAEGRALLAQLGMPFRQAGTAQGAAA
jgi:large subunit ribosomal protein L5